MNTSIGFHTFTIRRKIHGKDAKKLYRDFNKYRDDTKEIKFYVPSYEMKSINIRKGLRTHGIKIPEGPSVWNINYTADYPKGISWTFRFCYNVDFKGFIIEARINPKILAGIKDYITASNSSYLQVVEERFNEEAGKISDILGQFNAYTPKRVDFCINFDLKELGIGCTPEQMMQLIKMGNYPSYFKEWQCYDKISHRKKSPKYSFYLTSGTTNINCYYKYKQLEKEYPDCPNIEDALHIIRFEVQCKYRKTRKTRNIMFAERKRMEKEREELIKKYRDKHGGNYDVAHFENFIHRMMNDPIKIIHRMLSDTTAETVIEKYFKQIIGHGDYYTLKRAIEIVEDQDFTPQKEADIIYVLKEVNRHGVAKLRESLLPDVPPKFYRILETLAKLNINPVTIPKSFGVKHIPNLLDAFNKLRGSGLGTSTHDDPFEPLEKPFEIRTNNIFDDKDNNDDNDNLFESSDPAQDTEPEYEDIICFK